MLLIKTQELGVDWRFLFRRTLSYQVIYVRVKSVFIIILVTKVHGETLDLQGGH